MSDGCFVAPSRERELKLPPLMLLFGLPVAPSRERELKRVMPQVVPLYSRVAPSRERELKPAIAYSITGFLRSLPHGSVN